MSAPVVEPVSVAGEWVYQTLKADPTVLAQVPAGGGEVRVYPTIAPTKERAGHIVHRIAAGATDAPAGGPLLWTLDWDVTAWRQTADQPSLRPAMAAALAALCGARLAGRQARYVTIGDATAWDIGCRYAAPVPDLGDYDGPEPWERITHRLRIDLAPVWP